MIAIAIDNDSDNYFTNAVYYDSLCKPNMRGDSTQNHFISCDLAQSFQQVCSQVHELIFNITTVLENTTENPLPQQVNSINCGLFAMPNCLHIFEGMIIDRSIFTQQHIDDVSKIQIYSKFVFMSDQDKGLERSLCEMFPNNNATNCVHHIKQKNCCEVWKKACSSGICNCFILFCCTGRFSPIKITYHFQKCICVLLRDKWHTCEWLKNTNLPPRFDILMSNTSGSISSLIDKYHDLGWIEIVVGVLHHMT